jgi:hypothetical protein
MAITIDWANKLISVPQSFLTLLGGTLYELDIDLFRLALKDLEDSEDGMMFDDTHKHSPPVTLGGVVFARQVEIINGYEIMFEDGQYGVNITGGNSNLADFLIRNQVSVRTSNSGGLIVGEGADPNDLLDLPDSIETGLTLRQAQRLTIAALVGKLSGAESGSTTITIRDVADTKDRVIATVDADGNRLNIVLDKD